MKVTVLTPRKTIFQGNASSVVVPGIEGYAGFLDDHVPFVTPLKPGIVEIQTTDSTKRWFVDRGYIDYSPEGLSILVEIALTADEIDFEETMNRVRELEKKLASAQEGNELTVLEYELEVAKQKLEVVKQ